jgi:2,4-dienoyl-CoA reductase-like NADH-dependent reductase (Old Yellow Enzyme family)/thioredoxin reductase
MDHIFFPKLSEPGLIGNLKVKNRFVMAPAGTNYSNPDGSVTPRLLKHYQARAQGGVGLVIVEFSHIDDGASKSLHGHLGIYDDQLIPGLSLLARVIHEYGAKAAIQIVHAGLQRSIKSYPIVAPSRVWKEYLGGHGGIIPTELSIEEIQKITVSFGEAALRAKKAGFDMVEIHGAHGYLINQFLSLYTNRRTDMYGGSLEDRMRFPLEVVRKVRESVGSDYPLGVRMNGNDYVDGGVTIEEAKIFAQELEKLGVDILHVSSGVHKLRSRMIEPMLLPTANKARLAEEIKHVVNIPVIASGSLVTPELAEEILQKGKADFVSMARPLLADPEFPLKALEGRAAEIRPCIRCNEGCLQRGTFVAQAVKCTVNPATGFEEWLDYSRTLKPKHVLIVGGGPGGMEAAVTAATRGHLVTLMEKANALGGRLIEASTPDFKRDLRRLITYYSFQLRRLGVKVILGQEARAEDMQGKDFETVVVAAGSRLNPPEDIGVGGGNVVSCVDVLKGRPIPENEVIVVGGGMVGCEVGLFLAEAGKKVKIVEMLQDIGPDVDSLTKEVLLEKFLEHGVECFTNRRVINATKEGVLAVDSSGKKHHIQGHAIVWATGFTANTSLLEQASQLGIEVHAVGDCSVPGKIYEAIHDGNRVGRTI